MSGCVICGGELPPRRLGHNGGGRPRVMCDSVECRKKHKRRAARVAYLRLRELNARGFYAKWQHKTLKPRQPRGEQHASE